MLGRALVFDGKQPAGGRDQAVNRRQGQMGSRPLRLGDPPVATWRADRAVVGHGVVVGIVEMLLPLVEFLGPRLDGLRPPVALLQVHRPERRHNSHHFLAGHTAEIFGNDQVH